MKHDGLTFSLLFLTIFFLHKCFLFFVKSIFCMPCLSRKSSFILYYLFALNCMSFTSTFIFSTSVCHSFTHSFFLKKSNLIVAWHHHRQKREVMERMKETVEYILRFCLIHNNTYTYLSFFFSSTHTTFFFILQVYHHHRHQQYRCSFFN